MNKHTLVLAAIISAAVFAPHDVHAQATRTFVSGQGTDSGTCTLTAPCRSFAYALTQTASGGEIAVLNTAGYGTVTIAQPVSIVNPGGVEAGISIPSGGTGITVNNGYGQTVNLNGLTIEGANVGATGISYTGQGALNILGCTVRDMTQTGISVVPAYGSSVVIADTTVANNATSGILAKGDSSGSLTLTLSRDKIINNGFAGSGIGVDLVGTEVAYQFTTIDTTLIAENGTGLVMSTTGTPNEVTAFVIDSHIVNNMNSITINASTSLALERTAVATAYGGGIINRGAIESFGDNAIRDSVTGTPITTVALK